MSLKRRFQTITTGMMAAMNRWQPLSRAVGVAAPLVLLATVAHGQVPLGAHELAAPEKVGVTLYQINGFTGTVPMKEVYVVEPGPWTHTQLEFASSTMNEQMQFMAKAVAPPGMIFKSFGISTSNGHHQITPASADYFDGKKIIAKVTISPWPLNNLLKQCREQLTNPDGTFKNSVTFDLEVGANVVHGKAVFAYEADPGDPAKWQSRSATVHPKTRVTAYVVPAAAATAGSRSPRSPGTTQTGGRALPPAVPTVGRPAVRIPPRGAIPEGPSGSANYQGGRVPGRHQPGARHAIDSRLRPAAHGPAAGAKPQFERTKPHVNSDQETSDLRLPAPRRHAVRLPR